MMIRINEEKQKVPPTIGGRGEREAGNPRTLSLTTILSTESTSNVTALPFQRDETEIFLPCDQHLLGGICHPRRRNVRSLWVETSHICILLRKCHRRSVYLNCGP